MSSPSVGEPTDQPQILYSSNSRVISFFLKVLILMERSIFGLYSLHNLTPVDVINFSAILVLIFGGRNFEAPLVLYE